MQTACSFCIVLLFKRSFALRIRWLEPCGCLLLSITWCKGDWALFLQPAKCWTQSDMKASLSLSSLENPCPVKIAQGCIIGGSPTAGDTVRQARAEQGRPRCAGKERRTRQRETAGLARIWQIQAECRKKFFRDLVSRRLCADLLGSPTISGRADELCPCL